MIPKIIHYCWFGGKEIPKPEQDYIASWHKFMPDYEFMLWNEENFDINSVVYVKEAYECKKYAFVSDYVRLWALDKFGGIYFDTDVEVLKPFDYFLGLPAFAGYEDSAALPIGTCVLGSRPHGVWVQEQLGDYDNRHFIDANGNMDLTTNVQTVLKIMKANGFKNNGLYSVYKNELHVFPCDYFSPLSSTRLLKITGNTYSIHHFAGTWKNLTFKQKTKQLVAKNIFGYELTDKIVRLKRKLLNKKMC